jgi:hypothetical protein
MGALSVLGYLGMILIGPLFRNSGRDLYPPIHLNLVFKILNVIFGSIIMLIV